MAEPSTQFWERVLTPEVRQAGAVGASLEMIALLPEEKEKARTSVVEVACLEAWFVHMRLLTVQRQRRYRGVAMSTGCLPCATKSS